MGNHAWAQEGPTFSVEFQGPVIGFPDGFGSGLPISEGELLFTPAPMPFAPVPPGVSHAARANPFGVIDLGIPAPWLPPMSGIPSVVEVDALSFGLDHRISAMPLYPSVLSFSVDEHAVGNAAVPAAPNVATEGIFGSGEASADVFVMFPPTPLGPTLPAPPFALPTGNTQLFDGDGMPTPVLPLIPPLPGGPVPHGLRLFEPNPPTPGFVPDPGDNLDALNVDSPGVGSYPVYFSLDSAFADSI